MMLEIAMSANRMMRTTQMIESRKVLESLVMIHPTIKQPKVVKDPHTGEIKEQITPDTIVEMKDLLARQKRVAERVIALGKKLGIRVIATNDVHFLEAEDDDSHDVLLALSTDMDGDATAGYVAEMLKGTGVKVTRLAFGLPADSGIAYSDPLTLKRAVINRIVQ